LGSDNSSAECAEQTKNFEKITDTNRDDWVSAELGSNEAFIDNSGKKYFKFSNQDTKGFKEIEPYFLHLEKTNPQRLQRLKIEHEANRGADDKSSGKWWHSCQYCGHGIIYEFIIKNEKEKLKMTIGSHCVKGFKNVDPFTDLIRKRNEKTLRNALKGWINPIINQIWTDDRLASRRSYWDEKQQKWRLIPKKKFIDYADFLKKIDVDKLTVKEIKNIFKKSEKLEFVELPVFVEEIIHPRLTKQKTKKTGFDEFFWN